MGPGNEFWSNWKRPLHVSLVVYCRSSHSWNTRDQQLRGNDQCLEMSQFSRRPLPSERMSWWEDSCDYSEFVLRGNRDGRGEGARGGGHCVRCPSRAILKLPSGAATSSLPPAPSQAQVDSGEGRLLWAGSGVRDPDFSSSFVKVGKRLYVVNIKLASMCNTLSSCRDMAGHKQE